MCSPSTSHIDKNRAHRVFSVIYCGRNAQRVAHSTPLPPRTVQKPNGYTPRSHCLASGRKGLPLHYTNRVPAHLTTSRCNCSAHSQLTTNNAQPISP